MMRSVLQACMMRLMCLHNQSHISGFGKDSCFQADRSFKCQYVSRQCAVAQRACVKFWLAVTSTRQDPTRRKHGDLSNFA